MLIARGLAGYRLFLKVRPTALLTWPVRRPAHFPFLLALGAIAAALAVINSTMNRPFHHVYSQGVMAVYFTVIVIVPSNSIVPFCLRAI